MHYKNLILLIILYFNLIYFFFFSRLYKYKSKSNLRAGPGPLSYKLDIKIFQNMPVKVLEKNSTYTKVELYDGTKGWVWNATISKKKYYIVIEDSYIIDKNKKKIALVKKMYY